MARSKPCGHPVVTPAALRQREQGRVGGNPLALSPVGWPGARELVLGRGPPRPECQDAHTHQGPAPKSCSEASHSPKPGGADLWIP